MFPEHRYYYLHNFQQALDWLAARYADVLGPAEQEFLRAFPALPMASRALLVRLLMRRHTVFRAQRLQYEEIGAVAPAAEPLLALGWLRADPVLPWSGWAALHTKDELARRYPQAVLRPALRKPELLTALQAALGEPNLRPCSAWGAGPDEAIWSVEVAPLVRRLRLMFFGNLDQAWSEFVLADLGVFQYEKVAIEAGNRAFQCAADVDVYLALQDVRDQLDAAQPDQAAALHARLAACETAVPWLARRRAKVWFRLGQWCERAADWQQAERAYRASVHPGARQRLIRVLERQQRFAEAHALAAQALDHAESETERQLVRRMMPRLARQTGGAAQPRRAGLPLAPSMLTLPQPADDARVERVAGDHFAGEGARVHWVENGLINSLFGLLCWDAVFLPVAGAFFHPFQRGPADLHEPGFRARRTQAFDACLDTLRTGGYRARILARFQQKAGIQSPFVSWGMLTPELLELALDCIPAEHLALWFARLLDDLAANRSGLPDLARFWPAERRYELIEVKGPGDRLQDNQIRWLEYAVAHDLPVRVCHVRWAVCQEPQEQAA
ncbi:VRR-NUC domain [Bordetella ansorpii]|uniref:phosphodiesterase I n=1 Tax=Bordetella ansorpii TaxID=288768 RepID=A0A157S4L1_9BORD|nr:VRR-NUC domain-containing protein [Bordetella ansorpii]SAI65325.1 VRR-NUC domain [Bordetella ansorpii]